MKVELRDIHKSFGTIRANEGVTLSIEPGTLHGLLGENGAGKSTLMKVLSGFLSPDRGEILLDGKPQEVLTSDLLLDKGFGISRYTSVARKAKELGMWKKNQLPVTLEEAVEGFKNA